MAPSGRNPHLPGELAEALVASAVDAIITTDPKGTIVGWNPAASRLYGYPIEEVAGRPLAMLSPPGDLPDLQDTIARVTGGELLESFDAVRVHRSGHPLDVSVSASPIVGPDGEIVGLSWVDRDVTGRRHVERMINHLAFHDPLTGLANRTLLLDRLQNSLDRARRHGGLVAVIFLDIDDFKQINDRLGHSAGDRVLQMVAARLGALLRPEDTLARIGGDEFVIVSDGMPSPEAGVAVAERLSSALTPPLDFDAARVEVTASVGVALGEGGHDPDQVLANADRAMYAAKARGSGAIASFDAPVRRG